MTKTPKYLKHPIWLKHPRRPKHPKLEKIGTRHPQPRWSCHFQYWPIRSACMTMGTHFNSTNPSGARALPLAAVRNEGGHYFPDKLWRWQIDQKNILNILPPQEYLVFVFFKWKVLRILWFGEKVDQKVCQTILPPPPRHVRQKFNFV